MLSALTWPRSISPCSGFFPETSRRAAAGAGDGGGVCPVHASANTGGCVPTVGGGVIVPLQLATAHARTPNAKRLLRESMLQEFFAISRSFPARAPGCNPSRLRTFLRTMQNVTEHSRRASPPAALNRSPSTEKPYGWGRGIPIASTRSIRKPGRYRTKSRPGKPFGITVMGAEMRVVVSIGEDDDRYLFRFVPGKGFDESSKTACPDLTGSHFASDGTTLYMAQMGLRRIVALDAAGAIVREIALPTRIGGMGFGPGGFYLISATRSGRTEACNVRHRIERSEARADCEHPVRRSARPRIRRIRMVDERSRSERNRLVYGLNRRLAGRSGCTKRPGRLRGPFGPLPE